MSQQDRWQYLVIANTEAGRRALRPPLMRRLRFHGPLHTEVGKTIRLASDPSPVGLTPAKLTDVWCAREEVPDEGRLAGIAYVEVDEQLFASLYTQRWRHEA